MQYEQITGGVGTFQGKRNIFILQMHLITI